MGSSRRNKCPKAKGRAELYRVESGWSVESKEGEREVGRASIMSGIEDRIQDLDFSLGSP